MGDDSYVFSPTSYQEPRGVAVSSSLLSTLISTSSSSSVPSWSAPSSMVPTSSIAIARSGVSTTGSTLVSSPGLSGVVVSTRQQQDRRSRPFLRRRFSSPPLHACDVRWAQYAQEMVTWDKIPLKTATMQLLIRNGIPSSLRSKARLTLHILHIFFQLLFSSEGGMGRELMGFFSFSTELFITLLGLAGDIRCQGEYAETQGILSELVG